MATAASPISTADDAVIETHNRMIDIQIVLDNEEQIGYTPRAALPPADYDEKHDISFYPTAEKRDYMTTPQERIPDVPPNRRTRTMYHGEERI